ncbi:VOC family protein [Undibacterium sp. SXout7W]|uniref:VOC family protein n=1 Tax=Undibacterium sp. SXout7W TaxID=3413049 RepID=UPI003BF29F67
MKSTLYQLRIARPVTHLQRSSAMYCEGLQWMVLSTFVDHQGFDGVIVGSEGLPYHLELTYCRRHSVTPQPTAEDLLVLYIADAQEWQSACDRMSAAGFLAVQSLNPYWDDKGRTFSDPDGYRVVLQNARWMPT